MQDTANGYGAAVLNTATTYAWSPRGDILSKTGIGTYTWDATTQRLSIAGNQRFTWDVRGNMTSRVSNVMDGVLERVFRTEFTFSPENTMVAATNAHTNDGGGTAVAFAYDYTGRRVRKTSSLGNNFQYINGNYAEKHFAEGRERVRTTHVYAGQEKVATLVDGEAHFIHRDHINSGGAITAGEGALKDRIAFSAHGKVLYREATTGPASEIEEKFTGQILDPETGLYYYNARYYDPEVGIFVSPDSMVPDGYRSQDFNRYMYCAGNPVRYTDPSGHFYFDSRSAHSVMQAYQAHPLMGLVATVIFLNNLFPENHLERLIREHEQQQREIKQGAILPAEAYRDSEGNAFHINAGRLNSPQEAWSLRNNHTSNVNSQASNGGLSSGAGMLSNSEVADIQALANRYNTIIDVVGSRAAGNGRNVGNLEYPVGKGEGTRSDIDFRYDGQVDINTRGALSDALRRISGGAGSPMSAIGPYSKPPFIRFMPGRAPQYYH